MSNNHIHSMLVKFNQRTSDKIILFEKYVIDLFKTNYEKDLTNEKFDDFVTEVNNRAKEESFNMDEVRIDGEFLGDGEIIQSFGLCTGNKVYLGNGFTIVTHNRKKIFVIPLKSVPFLVSNQIGSGSLSRGEG